MESDSPPPHQPPPSAPPLQRPPPLIVPAYAPRPARRATGWIIFSVILLVLLGFSVLLNFQHAVVGVSGGGFRNYRASGPKLDEVTLREGDNSANKIAVVPIEGVISGESGTASSMVSLVKEELERAQGDHAVKAVILRVNSPGGEVLASDEIANAIRAFQKKSGKPVVVSMGGMAASGGYYVSAPCDWIVASDLTITGSIGVIMHGYNFRGLMDKFGVKPQVFKSGKFKDMMSPDKEPEDVSPEENQIMQNLINETYAKFKKVVADGRQAAALARGNGSAGTSLSRDWADYADGRILSGTEALKLGLVDELGDFDAAVDRAKIIAKIKNAELIEYEPAFEISSLFRLLGKSDVKSVKLDLGVELPRLQAGCLYFLSSNYLH